MMMRLSAVVYSSW